MDNFWRAVVVDISASTRRLKHGAYVTTVIVTENSAAPRTMPNRQNSAVCREDTLAVTVPKVDKLHSPQDIAPDNPHIAPLWYYRNSAEPPLYLCTEITWHIVNLPEELYEMHRECVRDDYLWCLVFVHSEEGQPALHEECWRIFECEVCGETMSVYCDLTVGIGI